MNKYIIILLTLIFFTFNVNSNSNTKYQSINIDLTNKPSLQKGARIYFNYCQGCHSIKYMRYLNLAEGIGLKKTKNKTLEQIIQEYFMHSVKSINENNNILSGVSKEDALKWFGKVTPDLSLVAKYRGKDWIYSYMRGFYKDETKAWNVNNIIFPDVGMPHVLSKFQGVQILKDNIKNIQNPDLLELIENGEISRNDYNLMIKDLVTFLSYVSEPTQVERQELGYKVLVFAFIFMILLFLLKNEYWQDIKKK